MTLAALSIRNGDTYVRPLTITDTDGNVIDLTGATVTFHLRAPGATSTALSVALALTTPASGLATLTLTAAQTAALTPRLSYAYEVELSDVLSNISTPVEGTAYILEDIG